MTGSASELSKAFALAVPHEEALAIRDDVAFFQAVRAALAKRAPAEERPEEELDHVIRHIISQAIAPEGMVDLFAAEGLKKPDIPILAVKRERECLRISLMGSTPSKLAR